MIKENHHTRSLTKIRVTRRIGGLPHQARLCAGSLSMPCSLGLNGVTRFKREGDSATPLGRYALLFFYLRRARRLASSWRLIHRKDIWCDDRATFLYNRRLRSPVKFSHEEMWRVDHLYDVVGVIDYNICPPIRGRGSAIFFHLATDALEPTAGCIALRSQDMARLLPRLARRVLITIA